MIALEFFQFGMFFIAWVVFSRWVAGKLADTGIGPALAYISH